MLNSCWGFFNCPCFVSNCSLEKQKTLTTETLITKGVALCTLVELKRQSSGGSDVSELLSAISEIYLKLYTLRQDFEKDPKVGPFLQRHALANEQYGRYIKLLKNGGATSGAEEAGAEAGAGLITLETDTKIKWAFEQLKWNHIARHADRTVHVKFPKTYTLF